MGAEKEIKIVACTEKGAKLAVAIRERLGGLFPDYRLDAYTFPRHIGAGRDLKPLTSLSAWTAEHFSRSDAFIFVCACAIAVRAVAPLLRDKAVDPAVVAVDEQGKFAVALLSGHIGGANRLARQVAGVTGGQAVVSTATDLNGLLGIDEWARENRCAIVDLKKVKLVSSALLEGRLVGLYTDAGEIKTVPDGFVPVHSGGTTGKVADRIRDGITTGETGKAEQAQGPDLGVSITIHTGRNPFPAGLILYPRILSLGIGCRKNTPAEAIAGAVEQMLTQSGLARESLDKIASIDLKKDEAGIIELAGHYGAEFVTYPAAVLNRAEGKFTPSDFVREKTGTDNVCERAAVLASAQGKLIVAKQVIGGVTVAVAVRHWEIRF